MKTLSILVTVAIVLVSCSHFDSITKNASPEFSLDSAKAAITASNKLYSEAFAKGDSALFLSRYTTDGCIMPANAPKMCGAKALSQFFAMGKQMGIKGLLVNTEEVLGSKELVAETGTYELKGDAGKTLDKGKFIVLWKQENGSWKMFRDTWNTNEPPPAAAK